MSNWVRVRNKRVNLCYAILAEEYDGTAETQELLPGGVRLTIETGRVLVFPPGPDTERLLKAIDGEVESETPPVLAGGVGGVGTVLDAGTGEPLTRQSV